MRIVRSSTVGPMPLCLWAAAMLLVSGTAPHALSVVPLGDNHPDAAIELATEGRAQPGRHLSMQAYLAPRQRTKLDRLLEEQQDPASRHYHRWLTAAEYDARFGPRAADVDAVAAWLAAEGFRVTAASAHEGRVSFEGPVGTAEHAFRVRMAGSTDGRWYGNVEDPSIPPPLAGKIRHITGLHNLSATTMHTKILDPENNSNIDTPHFGPPDVYSYFNYRSVLDAGCDGRDQCIAVLEGSPVDQASLDDFTTVFALPPLVAGQNYDTVFPHGPIGVQPPINGRSAQAYAEAAVDIEYAHALAPAAQIVNYAGDYAGLGTQGLVDTVTAATSDNRCGTIAISWAQCGQPKSFFRMLDDQFARGAAQGQTIFIATGDVGTAGPTLFNRKTGGCQVPSKPTVEENAASPNVTACGATEIHPQYDDAGLNVGVGTPVEEVWFFDFQHILKAASTGGVSTVFKKPKFQKKVKGVKFKKRAVPDICLGGGSQNSPGYWECLDIGLLSTGTASGPTCTIGGGTSLVPPQLAGVTACLQQRKGTRLGNINPQLYAMALANPGNPAAVGIRDVTIGNNGYDPVRGFDAKPGFDLASGWGSLDLATFVEAYLSFTPPTRARP